MRCSLCCYSMSIKMYFSNYPNEYILNTKSSIIYLCLEVIVMSLAHLEKSVCATLKEDQDNIVFHALMLSQFSKCWYRTRCPGTGRATCYPQT